nr:hypothetical protein GCM10020092_052760 [Actinoplanes digitatis]
MPSRSPTPRSSHRGTPSSTGSSAPTTPPRGSRSTARWSRARSSWTRAPSYPPSEHTRLRGRSWSAGGAIRHVEVSTDGGARWRRARKVGGSEGAAWQRWEIDWRLAAGEHELLARATDVRGNTQPDTTIHNSLGYLFDAVVRHRVVAA